jgi:Response regulator containing CheY-like receiver domain and AraC-type DNA-binding domain
MYKVLLVEDEEVIAEGIIQIIKDFQLGFDEFVNASDGIKAIEFIESFVPDVIVTDIKMDRLDGLELIKSIRERNDSISSIPIIIISGYADFQYAKTAIARGVYNYILKPVSKSELFETFFNICNLLKDNRDKVHAGNVPNIYNTLFQSDNKNKFSIVDLLKQLSITCEAYKQYYFLEIANIGTKDNINQYIQKIEEFLTDHAFISGIDIIHAFKRYDSKIILLGMHDRCEDNYSKLSEQLNNFLKAAKLCDKVKMYISPIFSETEDIKNIYSKIVRLKKYMDLFKEKAVYTYDEIINRKKDGSVFNKEYLDICLNIDEGKLQQTIEIINRIYEYIKSDRELSISYIENTYKNIFIEIHRRYGNSRIPEEYRSMLDNIVNFSDIIENSNTFNEIHQKSRELLIKFFYLYNNHIKYSCTSNDYIISETLKVVYQNFHKFDFSFKDVAKKVHVSEGYLSILFKNSIGMSFTDYLCKVRIEKAIEYLKDPEIPISVIGEKIGYTGEKYFFYIFKRYTGQTPAKYRKTLIFK